MTHSNLRRHPACITGAPTRGLRHGLALPLLAVLAGPAGAETGLPALALPDPMPAPPQTVLLPASDERIEAAIATLDTLGADILERTGIPGLSIAVVHAGETVYAEGFGLRASDAEAPVDADTVFLLASVSKPVGATVVATQVAEGLVDWDDPVTTHLPGFTLGDDWISAHVTIGDLYAHRSGLPDHAGDDLEDIGYGRQEVLERLSQLPLGAFRQDYAYTNFGLTAAAEAVARAAGTDWASLSEAALYEPLGMGATSSRHADYMARQNRAASHVPGADGYRVADRRQPDPQSPAGGVSSSARDMARWMALILSDGSAGAVRIPDSALRPATSPQSLTGLPMGPDARAGTYGYGFGTGIRPSGRVSLSHSGAFALGASTSVAMVPDMDLGIVVLTNAPPTGAAEAITQTFLDRAELGLDSRDWLAAYGPIMAPLSAPVGELVGATPPEAPAPAAPEESYVGTYDNAYFGPARIASAEGGLVLHIGPADTALPLQHWDGDTFVIHPVTENQPEGSVSQLRFTHGDDGHAETLWIEHLDHYGLGSFERAR